MIVITSEKFTNLAASLEAWGVGFYEGLRHTAPEFWKKWFEKYVPMEYGHWRTWSAFSGNEKKFREFYQLGMVIGRILSIRWNSICVLAIRKIEVFAVVGYKNVVSNPVLSSQIKEKAKEILAEEEEMEKDGL